MKQIKLALKMLRENQPENTKMPNLNITLKEYLLSLGIKVNLIMKIYLKKVINYE